MRRSILHLLSGLALTLAACEGTMNFGGAEEARTPSGETAQDSTDPGTPGTAADVPGSPEAPAAEEPPPFELRKTDIRLLPFHVRMQKLEGVAGVSKDDRIFDEIRQNRYDLGDHDYGQNIGPDLAWNASKMSLWVESLLPVCQSQAMRAKYPELPEHLNELATAAYGRPADETELASFEDVLAGSSISEEKKYETVCLAVLSSTEFVAQ